MVQGNCGASTPPQPIVKSPLSSRLDNLHRIADETSELIERLYNVTESAHRYEPEAKSQSEKDVPVSSVCKIDDYLYSLECKLLRLRAGIAEVIRKIVL